MAVLQDCLASPCKLPALLISTHDGGERSTRERPYLTNQLISSMTVFEKVEQAFTKRPSSYIPGHTLRVLLGLPNRPNSEMFGLNMVSIASRNIYHDLLLIMLKAMHYGQGALAAGARGLMSFYGVRVSTESSDWSISLNGGQSKMS